MYVSLHVCMNYLGSKYYNMKSRESFMKKASDSFESVVWSILSKKNVVGSFENCFNAF